MLRLGVNVALGGERPAGSWIAGMFGGRRWVLLAHALLIQGLTFIVRPTMSYRALELDVPAAWLGFLAASFAVAPLALALPVGQAVDRFGEWRVATAGAALVTASGVAFLVLGGSVAGLAVAGAVFGVGHLGCVVGQQALVANTTDRRGYATAFGHYTFAASLGQVGGPMLIAAFGGDRAIPDTTPIFLWSCALGAVLVVLSVLLPRPAQQADRGRRDAGGLAAILRTPGIAYALLTSCVVLAAVDIVLVYLPALGTERGLASGTIGVLLAVRGVASMASRLFLGRIAEAVGRRRLLVVSTAGAALALLAAPLPLPVWTLGVLMFAIGFGLGVGQPLTMAWLAEAAPPGLRGRAMSLRMVGNRTGQLLIPSTAGLVAAGLGAGGVLWLTAFGLGWAGLAARRLPADPVAPAGRDTG